MPEGDKRRFALRDENGNEPSVYTGTYPRQAALKAARRLDPDESKTVAENNTTELRLREHSTDKVHMYDGWAWEEPATEDDPDWVDDTVTKANVSKQGTRTLDER
jgi:hypothetical protein